MKFNQYEKDLALDVLHTLDEYGWWGGTQEHNEKHQFCVGQAVLHVLKNRNTGEYVESDFSRNAVCKKIVGFVNEKTGFNAYSSVPSWNDDSSTSYEDIQRLLKEIATWEEPYTPPQPRDARGRFAKRHDLAEAVDSLIP